MRIEPRLRLRFDDVEADVLRQLLDSLYDVLTDPLPGDPVLERLDPSARPDDERAAAEYRALVGSTLHDDRLARIAACRADLDAGVADLTDAEAERRWLQTLNELRLALGTRIGVGEDDPPWQPGSPDDPHTLYHWLTAVQDTVVGHLLDG